MIRVTQTGQCTFTVEVTGKGEAVLYAGLEEEAGFIAPGDILRVVIATGLGVDADEPDPPERDIPF